MANDYSSHEWSAIDLPAEFQLDDSGKAIGLECETVVVERRPDLSLCLTASGSGLGPSFDDCEAGRRINGLSIAARTSHRAAVQIAKFWPDLVTRTPGHRGATTTITGGVESVTVMRNRGEAHSLVEWLCHVPSDIAWPGTTLRTRTLRVERTREHETLENELIKQESHDRDHVVLPVSLPLVSTLRFGRVSEKQVVAVAGLVRPGFLEFERGQQGLPDGDLRYSIRSALNFLFGCGLTRLGYSEFDSERRLLRSTAQSAVRSGGGDQEWQPAPLSHDSMNLIDATLCTRFVQAFVAKESAYNLNRAVWAMRHSLTAPADMSAAYLGVAFEVLRDGYYKQPSNELRTRRLSGAKWSRLAADFGRVINQHEPTADGQDAAGLVEIRTAIGGLNGMSGRGKSAQFLKDLKLATGQTEEAALLARNDAAHGNPFDESNADRWLATTYALRTLVGRVIFALLDVLPNAYVDYGSSGRPDFPLRVWTEPQELRVPLRT